MYDTVHGCARKKRYSLRTVSNGDERGEDADVLGLALEQRGGRGWDARVNSESLQDAPRVHIHIHIQIRWQRVMDGFHTNQPTVMIVTWFIRQSKSLRAGQPAAPTLAQMYTDRPALGTAGEEITMQVMT